MAKISKIFGFNLGCKNRAIPIPSSKDYFMKNGLIINKVGNKFWFKNDLLHNNHGPAVEFTDGENIGFLMENFID